MEHFKRLDAITKYIQKQGRVTTTELSKKFNVSNQTVRKDLKELESDNKIKRIHGGAIIGSTFNDRLDINIENKKLLCRKAAQYIEDGDYVYIDGGTSYFYLIDYVPQDYKITVVTSSIPIAQRIKNLTHHDVYLLGGLINSTTMETYSSNIYNEISSMMFNKSFMGVTGFVKGFGFTEDNVYSLEVKSKIKENTATNIVVAGKEKEGVVAFRKSFDFQDINIFITNSNISDSMTQSIKDQLDLVLI